MSAKQKDVKKQDQSVDPRRRRKRLVSVLALVLAAMMLIWTVLMSMGSFLSWGETGGVFSSGGSKNSAATAAAAITADGLLSGADALTAGDRRMEAHASPGEADDPGAPASESMVLYLRGIWVSTAYNLDFPTKWTTDAAALRRECDEILNRCQELGMNTVFFQVRPSADAMYRSDYFPWSRFLSGSWGVAPSDGFDPLAYMVRGAHARNMELHAWINPYRTGITDQNRASVLAVSPGLNAVSSDLVKYGSEYYLDPSSQNVRNLITNGALEIVNNYDVDGIHMDDYFYPAPDFADDAAYQASGTFLNRDDWRRDNVNQLIKQMNYSLHQADPEISFGISPVGVWANKSAACPEGSDTRGLESRNYRYADSVTWIQNHWIDYIAPQIYWAIGFDRADYAVLTEWWSRVTQGTGVRLYIGMADYRAVESGSKDEWGGTDMLRRELDLNAWTQEVSGEIHFRYKSIAEDAALTQLYQQYYQEKMYRYAVDILFTDILDHWAKAWIESLAEDGILNGMGNRLFMPDRDVTRAQFVKMLSGLVPETELSSPPDAGFTDVVADAWYADYVNWAADREIVSGMGDGTFAPEETITREQMTLMLVQFADAYAVTFGDENPPIRFEDREQIDEWALDSVDAAVAGGLINGFERKDETGAVTGFEFQPLGTATRAQAAKVIYLVREKMEPFMEPFNDMIDGEEALPSEPVQQGSTD